jgi:GDSL-like Lipase/Acylhydrolase family
MHCRISFNRYTEPVPVATRRKMHSKFFLDSCRISLKPPCGYWYCLLSFRDPSIFKLLMGGQMIFFGANDACVPGRSQHVPLGRYIENLKLLCLHPSVVAQGAQVILVTPPPVNEYQMDATQVEQSYPTVPRTAAQTKKYADACREVARYLDLPLVDLWQAFMCKAGWKEGEPLPGSKDVESNEELQKLLLDGMSSITYRSAIIRD